MEKKNLKKIDKILDKSNDVFNKSFSTPAVELRNVLIDFGGLIAVDNVNLKIKQGELVTLLGPSGCGKTTTLNAIAGLLKPTSGMILFKGKDVTNFAPQKRKLGLVFQNYALYPHMSVYKNISFPLLNDQAWQASIVKNNEIMEFEINKIILKANGAPDKELKELQKRFFAIYDTKREVQRQFNKYESRSMFDLNTLTAQKSLIKSRYKTSIKKVNIWGLKEIDKLKENKNLSSLKKEIKLKKNNLKINHDNKLIEIAQKIQNAKTELIKNNYKEKIKKLKINLKILPKETINIFNQTFNNIKSKYSLNDDKLNDSQKQKIENYKKQITKLKVAVHNAIMEVAQKVEITNNLQKMPTKLSGGQQQRVAIARGIVKNPDILLMDEPLSNLDAKLRIQTRNWIRLIQQQLGITLIFVTHDQEEAMAISDKIICLNNGHIQQIGSPMELYNKPQNEFVAKFLGMPEMKIISATVDAKSNIKIFGKNVAKAPAKITKVNIGLRADNFIENSKGIIKGKIVSIENLGKEVRSIIDVEKFGKTSVTLVKKQNYKIGEEIKLNIDTKKIHFFNANTKERINV